MKPQSSQTSPKSPRSRKTRAPSAALPALAHHLESQLNFIQRRMRQGLQAEFARGNLTGPQRLVMEALVRADGLSLKQLSASVNLAHSTVSGIVDRLEKQGLLERQTDAADRRISRIVPSRAVRKFLTVRVPQLTVHPLVRALGSASPAQRAAIAAGLDALAKLLAEQPADAG